MQIAAFWFRRDLRLIDNAGLYYALKSGLRVQSFFIFDQHILNKLTDKTDKRVQFIHKSLSQLKKELQAFDSDLIILHDTTENAWKKWIDEYPIASIFSNRDYEPYGIQRDLNIKNLAAQKGISFHQFKDQILFESQEIQKKDGGPYTVFTPYKNACLKKLLSNHSLIKDSFFLKSYPSEKYIAALNPIQSTEMPSLESIGFHQSSFSFPSIQVAQHIIKNYHLQRDYPSRNGTSRLGIHFRFGTISIRQKAKAASQINSIYLNEILWRDFYSSILQAFPFVVERSFKPLYDHIVWRNNEIEFSLWCTGNTGIPLVDAGMRELNSTGFMHNRVRMITASFLVKNLLIDWRWGEAYFASKLLDFDLASNNGGWQWAAGCGTDAAPYFRIFNPITQQIKFDPEFIYIKKWVPEYNTKDYPEPIVDLQISRIRCLKVFNEALSEGKLQ